MDRSALRIEKVAVLVVLVSLGAGILLIALSEDVEGRTLIVDKEGGPNFKKIQDAIDSSQEGDTILVKAGRYDEKITIDKSIELRGEGRGNTTIKGNKEGNVVTITANNTVISGFTIKNGGNDHSKEFGSGIRIDATGCYIHNTTCKESGNGMAMGYFGLTDEPMDFSAIIENNSFIENERMGIYLRYASGNIIRNNICNDNSKAILLSQKFRNNTIIGNICKNNRHRGISLEAYALFHDRSHDNNTISDNIVTDTTYGPGILVQSSNYNVISNNTCLRNDILPKGPEYCGITLTGSSNNIISGNNCSENDDGISIGSYCYNNIISDNVCSENSGTGIQVSYYANTIRNNRCFGNEVGISLSDRYKGYAVTCEVTGNEVFGNVIGIFINSKSRTTCRNNTLEGNSFLIDATEFEVWDLVDIDSTNTVNGKPVAFIKDIDRLDCPDDPGQIILFNVSGGTIKGLSFSKNTIGIQCAFSRDIVFSDVSLREMGSGIELYESSNITLINSSFSMCDMGIYSDDCDNITLEGNDFYFNRCGAKFSGKSNATIRANIFSNNSENGIELRLVSDALLSENEFSNNSEAGLRLSRVAEITVENNTFTNNKYGIYLYFFSRSDKEEADLTITDSNIFSGNKVNIKEKYPSWGIDDFFDQLVKVACILMVSIIIVICVWYVRHSRNGCRKIGNDREKHMIDGEQKPAKWDGKKRELEKEQS